MHNILLCLLTVAICQAQSLPQEEPLLPDFDLSQLRTKIISGFSVYAEDLDPETALRYPYVVSLRYSYTSGYVCGGVLVSATYVVTAAQCTQHDNPIYVEFGDINEPSYKRIPIVDAIQHPDWEGGPQSAHNIALLRLGYTSEFPLIQFPTSTYKIEEGHTLSLLSRGRQLRHGGFTHRLQIGRVDYTSMQNCSAAGMHAVGQPGMMCLGGKNAGACTGDEGSPIVKTGSSWKDDLLLGIVSFTDARTCGSYPYPGVYTRVDAHGSWISSIIS